MNKVEKWFDSYYHYRTKVGLGVFASFYRAAYYEIKHKEPRKWQGARVKGSA